jgi:hypothetical protein
MVVLGVLSAGNCKFLSSKASKYCINFVTGSRSDLSQKFHSIICHEWEFIVKFTMRFTTANARENAAKALASRKANYLAMKAAKNGQSLQLPASPAMAAEAPATDDFSRARLACVRKQLNRIDDMMKTETDPAKLDKLASALSRLAEQERQLAGRPLPGSLRPKEPKSVSIFTKTPVSAIQLQPGPVQSNQGKFEQE